MALFGTVSGLGFVPFAPISLFLAPPSFSPLPLSRHSDLNPPPPPPLPLLPSDRSLSVSQQSTLLINPDIPEACELKGWYDKEGKDTSEVTLTLKTGGGGNSPSIYMGQIKVGDMQRTEARRRWRVYPRRAMVYDKQTPPAADLRPLISLDAIAPLTSPEPPPPSFPANSLFRTRKLDRRRARWRALR